MNIILEILSCLLGDLIFSTIIEVLVEFGISSAKKSLKVPSKQNRLLGFAGCFFLGLIFGFISILILPKKIFQLNTIPGLSLLVTPFLSGLLIHAVGKYQQERGRKTTMIATFMGGALFALSFALVRFIFWKAI